MNVQREKRLKKANVPPEVILSVFFDPPAKHPDPDDPIFERRQIRFDIDGIDEITFHGCNFNYVTNMVEVFFSSPSFDEVENGATIPLIEVQYRYVHVNHKQEIVGTGYLTHLESTSGQVYGNNWRELPPLF